MSAACRCAVDMTELSGCIMHSGFPAKVSARDSTSRVWCSESRHLLYLLVSCYLQQPGCINLTVDLLSNNPNPTLCPNASVSAWCFRFFLILGASHNGFVMYEMENMKDSGLTSS